MKEILVSIVLPIFNVERYLDRCMDSVVNQTYKNIEIIMVDDGSTDSCGQKCDEWSKRDSRIKVIHKNNEGLGYARNTGLANASGDYIVFFDSDDYIALNTISKLVDSANKYNSDIVIFGFSRVNAKGNIQYNMIPESSLEVFKGNEILSIVLPDLLSKGRNAKKIKNLWVSTWVNMFSIELIKRADWKFVSEREIIAEDVYSLLDLYSDVNTVSIVKEALYYYCENQTSLTQVYRKDRFGKINYFYDKCMELISKKNYNVDICNNLSYIYLANIIGALKLIVNSDLSLKSKYLEVDTIVKDKSLIGALNKIDLKTEEFSRKLLIKKMLEKRTLSVFLLLIFKTHLNFG